MKTSNEKNTVASSPVEEHATVDASVSSAPQSKEAKLTGDHAVLKPATFEKQTAADAIDKAVLQFIKTPTGVINCASVAGVIVINAPSKKAVALYDAKGG